MRGRFAKPSGFLSVDGSARYKSCSALLHLMFGFGVQRFAIGLPTSPASMRALRRSCGSVPVCVQNLLPICLANVVVMFRVFCSLFCAAATLVLPAAAGHTRIDVRMESAPLPLVASTKLSGASSAGFLTVANSLRGDTQGTAGPEFDRETQAPLIWLNLHKPAVGSVDGAPVESFDVFAAQRIAQSNLRR